MAPSIRTPYAREPFGSREVSRWTITFILAPLLLLLLWLLVTDVQDRTKARPSAASLPLAAARISTAPAAQGNLANDIEPLRARAVEIDNYFDSLIEKSPKDSDIMRLKSTPTLREIERRVGAPKELTFEKPGDTPPQYVTELNPVTYATWKGAYHTVLCQLSHRDGRLFDLSLQSSYLTINGVGRPWRRFHYVH